MKKKVSIALMFLFFIACNKQETEEATGTIKDRTNLDGCQIMIVLDNGTALEPVEIPPNLVLEPEARVSVTYRPVSTYTICMAGPTVKIVRLRYL